MTEILILIIIFYIFFRYLLFLLNNFKTGNKHEKYSNEWMLTYDFKADKIKNIFDTEDKAYIKKRNYKNFLRVLLYFNVVILFYLLNCLVAFVLIFIA